MSSTLGLRVGRRGLLAGTVGLLRNALGLGLGGRGRAVHDALPVEHPALLDDEGLRGDVAVDATAPGEMRLPLDLDRSLEAAGDADVLRADVRLDLALRGQRDVALGVDLTLHLTVDPEVPRRDDVALQSSALADDRDLSAVRHDRLRSGTGPAARPHVVAPPDHASTAAC